MSCNPGIGTFCPGKGTWTPSCGNLRPTGWHPYDGSYYSVENYGSCMYNCTGGYGRGCGCGGQSGCKCGPYNKLGPPNHYGRNNPPDHSHGKENYYNSLSTEWSVSSNVTPSNHDLKYEYTHWKKHPKGEGYSIGCGGCRPTP